MRRTLSAVVLAVAIVAVSASATNANSNKITPSHGTYLGSDHHGHEVTFELKGNKIINFKVGHTTSFPQANVSGHQVHHTCGGHPQHCIRGSWTGNHTFKGFWNNPNHGGDMAFEAYQFAT